MPRGGKKIFIKTCPLESVQLTFGFIKKFNWKTASDKIPRGKKLPIRHSSLIYRRLRTAQKRRHRGAKEEDSPVITGHRYKR